MTYELLEVIYNGAPQIVGTNSVFNIVIVSGITGAPANKFKQYDSSAVTCPMTDTGDQMKTAIDAYATQYIIDNYGPIGE